jgi:hypothetical protein
MTNLYYEAHITIDPVFDIKLEQFKMLSKRYNFRVAKLLMEKGGEYNVPSTRDSFCTSRSTDFTKIVNDTICLVDALKIANFKVRRYKIEDTIVDSNIKDKYGLL